MASVRAWKCQNWPMKVNKGQHPKAKRKCSCHRTKCDRGADAWNKFEDSTRQCFPYQCWATCTAKDKNGVLKEFLANMLVSMRKS